MAKCFMISEETPNGRKIEFAGSQNGFNYYIDEYREFFQNNAALTPTALFDRFMVDYPGITRIGMERIQQLVSHGVE